MSDRTPPSASRSPDAGHSDGRHLWDFDHPYYCSESNYYSNEPGQTWESWVDFVNEGMYDSDPDLNLLFRWDWIRRPAACPKCHGEGYAPGVTDEQIQAARASGDESGLYCPRCEDLGELKDVEPVHYLSTFWVLQRKCIFACHEIRVRESDEASIRAWLADRAKTIVSLWEPFALTERRADD